MLFTNDNPVATFLRDPAEQDEAAPEEREMGTGEALPDKARPLEAFKEKIYVLTVLAPPHRAWGSATWNHELEAALLKEMSAPVIFSLKGLRYETDPACLLVRKGPYRLERYAPGGKSELGWCLDLQVTLREGKNQQIRRIAKRSKLIVVGLHRETFAHILHVGSVPKPGDMRHLTPGEVVTLRAAAQAGGAVR